MYYSHCKCVTQLRCVCPMSWPSGWRIPLRKPESRRAGSFASNSRKLVAWKHVHSCDLRERYRAPSIFHRAMASRGNERGIAGTGFLVAFGNRNDQHHRWAVTLAHEVTDPLLTCEAVLAETLFISEMHGWSSISLEPGWPSRSHNGCCGLSHIPAQQMGDHTVDSSARPAVSNGTGPGINRPPQS